MKPSCIFMEIGRYFIACYAHFELDKKEFEIKFPIFFSWWILLLAGSLCLLLFRGTQLIVGMVSKFLLVHLNRFDLSICNLWRLMTIRKRMWRIATGECTVTIYIWVYVRRGAMMVYKANQILRVARLFSRNFIAVDQWGAYKYYTGWVGGRACKWH